VTRTAQETFWSDQALAQARDVAADGRTIAIVNDFPNGEQCSWCDCTLDNGSPVRRDIPVCKGHLDDAIVFAYRALGGRR
jgi:hypothetical protein